MHLSCFWWYELICCQWCGVCGRPAVALSPGEIPSLVPCQRQQRRSRPGAAFSSSWRRCCGVMCSYGCGRKSCDDGVCGRHSTFLKVSRKPMLQSSHLRPSIPSSTFVSPSSQSPSSIHSSGVRLRCCSPVSAMLLCMFKPLPRWPLCCGELSALGVVPVHLCSSTTQDASPTC